MDKIDVNGPDTHPVYRFLKSHSDGEAVSWNFDRFVCDRAGRVCHHRYAMSTPPLEDIALVTGLLLDQ